MIRYTGINTEYTKEKIVRSSLSFARISLPSLLMRTLKLSYEKMTDVIKDSLQRTGAGRKENTYNRLIKKLQGGK